MEKKMKLIFFSALFLLVLSGSGLAVWIMGLSTPTITANVVSSESSNVLSFSVELTDLDLINATNTSVSDIAIGEINNANGNLTNFVVSITDDVVDVNDTCTSNNDITTEWTIDGQVVATNDTIDLASGKTPITWEVSAVQSSCPGSASGQLTLSQ
ncbi:MAG: hypothetical protein GOV02_03890 [Candidatus Aenigmarchaeota archaeon]|nr:hypothetical protein [Candidatus Aenigmarchaeota archaeon]